MKPNPQNHEAAVCDSIGDVPTAPTLAAKLIELNEAGRLREARPLLESIQPEASDYPVAQNALSRLDAADQRYREAAERGHLLVAAGRATFGTITTTALCEHYAGRSLAAIELMLDFYRPELSYQIACCAATIGVYPSALRHLSATLNEKLPIADRAIVDVDFRELWAYLGSDSVDLEDCHCLMRPEFDGMREAARTETVGMPDYLDQFDYAELPEELRSAVVADGQRMVFRPKPPAQLSDDQGLAEKFTTWMRERVRIATAKAQQAFGVARARVIATQPHYANVAADRGDMMAARWHCEFVLRFYPGATAVLLDEARHPELRTLLEHRLEVESERPAFFEEFDRALGSGAREQAACLLDSLPDRLLGNGWVQWRYFRLCDESGDHETAIQAALATASEWKNDAAPYYNTITTLVHLEKWDEAARVLEYVPTSFWRLKRAENIADRLAAHDKTLLDEGLPRPFRGEPDLAGEIVPPQES